MKINKNTTLFVLALFFISILSDASGILLCPETMQPVKSGNSCCCETDNADSNMAGGECETMGSSHCGNGPLSIEKITLSTVVKTEDSSVVYYSAPAFNLFNSNLIHSSSINKFPAIKNSETPLPIFLIGSSFLC